MNASFTSMPLSSFPNQYSLSLIPFTLRLESRPTLTAVQALCGYASINVRHWGPSLSPTRAWELCWQLAQPPLAAQVQEPSTVPPMLLAPTSRSTLGARTASCATVLMPKTGLDHSRSEETRRRNSRWTLSDDTGKQLITGSDALCMKVYAGRCTSM